jgi:hypothetical protein
VRTGDIVVIPRLPYHPQPALGLFADSPSAPPPSSNQCPLHCIKVPHYLLLLQGLYGLNFFIQGQNIRERAYRGDTERVDLSMAPRVVSLDVFELRCLPKGRDFPVEVSHPLVDGGVARADVGNVAFEVL